MNLRLCAFLCAFALVRCVSVWAQDDKPADSPTPPPGVSAQLQGLLGGVLKPATKTKTPPAATTFVSTGKPLFVDEMLSKLTVADEQKQQFRKYADAVMKLVETAYKENGYPTNDVGVAFAGLLEVCYEIDHGTFKIGSTDKAEEARDKQRTKVSVRQMQRALGNTAAWSKLSEESKQLAYEACTFTIGHLVVSWQQAGKDDDKKKAVRELARQQLTNLFRFDPDGIARNKAGEFVPKAKANGEAGQAAPADTPAGGGTDAPAQPEPMPEPQPQQAQPQLEAQNEAAQEPVGDSPAPVVPAGWKAQRLASGTVLMTPPALEAGETFSVAVFPLRSLGGKSQETWLAAAIQNDPSKPGKIAKTPEIKASSANFLSAIVEYVPTARVGFAAVYEAMSMDQQTMRLIRIVMPPDGKALNRYKDDLSKIINPLVDADKKAAAEAGRGVKLEKLPTTPNGMSPGGALQPGIYEGNRLYGDEANGHYRLYLYPNRQYRMFNQNGKQINDVRLDFAYDHRTGKLDLESGSLYDMSNDRSDPDEDMCLFGRDAANKPYVYARSNRGFSYATTVLRYVGPLDKPSPAEEQHKIAEAEAEAKRYKLVVPPGQGLKPSEIAGILHNSIVNSFYNGSGMSVSTTNDLYLLLTDGTIYNGLPVAPDELDVSRSRRQESAKWGRWKRDGKTILAAWPDAPNQFRPLKGVLVKPGAKGSRLAGRFGTGATSGSLMGSSYRLWGVTFTPDGRFQKDNRGGYGSSIMAANSGMTSVNSTYDDEGSATSASDANVFVATSRKNRPGADRAGTYSVEGYALVLRFDDGHVSRLPFFFEDGDLDAMWFEGALLSLDKDKK